MKPVFFLVFFLFDKMKKAKKINNNFNPFSDGDLLFTALNSLDYPFYIIDISSREVVYANKAALINAGGKKKYCYQMSHAHKSICNTGEHKCPIDIVRKTKKTLVLEHIHINSKGEKRIVEVHAHPIKNKKNKLTHLIEYSVDITENKKSKELLAENEEMLRAIVESINDVIFIKNRDLKYTHINSVAEKYFNDTKSNVIGKSDEQIFDKGESERIKKIDKRILKGEVVKEEIMKKIRGENKMYLRTKSPLFNNSGEIVGICGVAHDVTESRRRELELSKKNKINQDILENSPLGMFVINSDGKATFVNKKMLDISGTSLAQFTSVNFFKHKIYKSVGIQSKIRNCFKGKRFELKNMKYTSMIGKKTTVRNFIGFPIDEKEETKVLMIVEDITELKEKEARLERSALVWSETFDSMSIGISIHSAEHKIINANKSLASLLDIKKDDLIGKKCYEIFHRLSGPIVDCPLERTLQSKKKESLEYFEEQLGRWLLVTTTPVFNEMGKIEKVIHVVDDITEKKKGEEDLKKRNEELEKFNSIAVNRELKMIELKKQIKFYKNKLTK